MATTQSEKVTVWVKVLLGATVAILAWFLGCFFYDCFTNSIGFARICTVLIAPVTALLEVFAFLGIDMSVQQSRVKSLLLSIAFGALIGVVAAITTCDVFGLRLQFIRTGQEPSTSQVDKSDSDDIYNSSRQGGAGSETNSNGQDGTTLSQENDGLPIDAPSPVKADDIPQESDEGTSIEDLTHSSPIAVSEPPDKQTVISYSVIEDFYRIAGIKATELDTTLSARNKAVWGASLEDKIKRLVGTEALPDAKQVNRDREFASKISQANELDRDIKENGEDIAKLRNLIALQEEAYALYAIADLRYGLAQNYLRLAKQYKATNQWDEGYTCCLEAIKYEFFYIRILSNCNDSYYIRLYELAARCQWIGDMDILDPDSKIQAFYLSACLLEAASKNVFSTKNENYQSKSYYYAGMVNHKLLNLCWKTKDRESSYYLLDAYGYYEKSLSYLTNLKYKYTYLAQLCSIAQTYIKRYGQADGMMTRAEYEELYIKYTDLGR